MLWMNVSIWSTFLNYLHFVCNVYNVYTGAEPGTALEAHKASLDGPTPLIERTINLEKFKTKESVADAFPSPSVIAAFVPNSSGRWLRRRKNDGSLNRVPDKFYPRVWRILSRSAGFRIGSHVL